MKKNYQLSASIICSSFINLSKEIKALEKGQIDRIHFDVMDGIFVPRYGLPPEILRQIHEVTDVPITVHMMVQDPESYVDIFKSSGADTIAFHVEPIKHVHRLVQKIKMGGMKAGLALNLATPLNVLDYMLQDLDLVMLMAINPGILGHKLIPRVLGKISDLKNKLEEYPDIKIEIDGGVTFESAPVMVKNGADILVCGNSTIFRVNKEIDKEIQRLRQLIGNTVYLQK